MRIDDPLYFSPGIRFDEVDFSGRDLPEQFRACLEVFYLRPADLSFWWIPLFNGSDSRFERDGNRFGPYIILISKGERDD